ncbi:Sterol desaturase/sphingolipid hydroxylase, fatty acid hydroxylase superfamily [Tenacibaculum sp. MAR_2009_124]|uniref:sterol desaturase family protein n=1 Tax=Tenacibaculum sp. MAR_2009_124 TaxID=1250059 RepID=UPI000897A389|nr:sterol desaturase family protein [Tenacibaculum sp. MAR_2009_124]SEC38301.1 Sterol desaturase/sphingolipid hydroxylase, fatty acid hydroxylase superfamily [Tenacibaculum sp. MAR_2009_124]
MELNTIFETLNEALEISLSYLISPKRRTYFIYLVTSALLAYYVYFRSKNKQGFLQYLFPKKVWLGKSAFVDYSMVIFNSLFKVIFIGPYLILGLYIAFYTNEFLLEKFGYATVNLGKTETIIYYTIALTVMGDFFTYLIHLLMHKIPFLWEFHKVHHSATELNPFTQYRIHPIELLINNAKSLFVFGVLTGIFDYLSNHQINKLIFLGVNVFGFVFMFLGANLRHSHIKLTYPTFIEKLLISPFQHQIHHSNSPDHFDKNMGSKLAIWDWMFGTLVLSKTTKDIEFGVEESHDKFSTFWGNLATPFINIYNSFRKLFK